MLWRTVLCPASFRVLAAFVPLALLDAQSAGVALLPVGDLLLPVTSGDPYLTPLAVRGRRIVLGEEDWMHGDYDHEESEQPVLRQAPAWFQRGVLQTLLAQLLDQDQSQLSVLDSDHDLLVRGGTATIVRAALEQLRQRLPPVVRLDVELRRHSAAGDEVVLARTVECAAGRRTWTSDVATTGAIVDYEVEIAQASMIADPICLPVRTGAMVVVRPFVSPTDATAWIDVLVRVIEPGSEPPIDTGNAGFGPIDRVAQRLFEVGGVVSAKLGTRTSQRWSGPDGTGYELRLSPTWQVAAPVRPGGHEVEYLPAWSALQGHRSVPWTQVERDLGQPTAAEAAFQTVITASQIEVLAVESTRAFVAVDAAAAELRGLVQDRHAAALPMALQVEVFDAAVGSALGDDGAPAGARRLGGAVLQTVLGSWTCATAFEELSLLRDWDVEVAQSARIGQPQCQRSSCGLFLNVRCAADVVQLDGEFSWRSAIDGRLVPLDVALHGSGSQSAHRSGDNVSVSQAPAVVLPQDVVRIENMTVHRLAITGQLALRRDAPAVLRRVSALLGAGRELVVTARRVD